jgi:hypothetical protein
VHAEPVAVLRSRNEQKRAFELGKPRSRVGAAEHLVAERRGELAQNRECVDERAAIVVERSEYLGAQVPGDEAMAALEPLHRLGRFLELPQPESGEHERGGPPLGARHQRLDVLALQRQLGSDDQQLVRLCERERKLLRAKLGQPAAGA